jgi:hypothetical protein
LKADKFIKDISDRFDNIINTGNFRSESDLNNNNNSHGPDKYNDEFYLDRGEEPPRFEYYRQARIDNCTDERRKKSFECVYDTITQDELDFALKRELRKSPEQRYQESKRNFLFHESCSYNRGLQYDDGYGCVGNKCIPECRFYPEYGVITDEVIAEHNKLIETYRRDNRIVDPPSNT